MTQKAIVLDAIGKLPDDVSIDEIADRVEFLAAIQKGIHQLDQGEGHPSRRDQEAARFMACKLIWSPISRDDLHVEVPSWNK